MSGMGRVLQTQPVLRSAYSPLGNANALCIGRCVSFVSLATDRNPSLVASGAPAEPNTRKLASRLGGPVISRVSARASRGELGNRAPGLKVYVSGWKTPASAEVKIGAKQCLGREPIQFR